MRLALGTHLLHPGLQLYQPAPSSPVPPGPHLRPQEARLLVTSFMDRMRLGPEVSPVARARAARWLFYPYLAAREAGRTGDAGRPGRFRWLQRGGGGGSLAHAWCSCLVFPSAAAQLKSLDLSAPAHSCGTSSCSNSPACTPQHSIAPSNTVHPTSSPPSTHPQSRMCGVMRWSCAARWGVRWRWATRAPRARRHTCLRRWCREVGDGRWAGCWQVGVQGSRKGRGNPCAFTPPSLPHPTKRLHQPPAPRPATHLFTHDRRRV